MLRSLEDGMEAGADGTEGGVIPAGGGVGADGVSASVGVWGGGVPAGDGAGIRSGIGHRIRTTRGDRGGPEVLAMFTATRTELACYLEIIAEAGKDRFERVVLNADDLKPVVFIRVAT